MRLTEEQAAELQLWAASKLEQLTETDPDVLADYVIALLNSDAQVEEVRKKINSELEDILSGNTNQFIVELFAKATSYHRPILPALKTFNPISSPTAYRNPIPISQAKSALRNAAPLSSDPPGSRKRSFLQAYGSDDQQPHFGNHRVCKRARGGGTSGSVSHASWRGRGIPAATSVNMQPLGLGLGTRPFNFPKPPTPPSGMPAFSPTDPAATFMAIFPYLTTVMANGSSVIRQQERCDHYDTHGYCMRGNSCQFEHVKQTAEDEARQEVRWCISDNEQATGLMRNMAQPTGHLPGKSHIPANNMSVTPDPGLDLLAFKAEQSIKQQDHKARLCTLKKTEDYKTQLARRLAEIDTQITTEKAKLMAKPGGDAILAQISSDLENERITGLQSRAAELEKTAVEHGIDPDVMSVENPLASRSRRASSILSHAPALSDVGGCKGKSQVICKFFPNCTNSACTFKHAPGGQTSEAPCKFFPNCINANCNFKHPGRHPTSNVLCKFFPNCKNMACTFKHPDSGRKSEVECKYSSTCTNQRCSFKHPEGSPLSDAANRVDHRPKSLLVSGVSVGLNNGADSMNMVRVAVMGITACESIQPQTFHDPVNSADDAHDGLVVTFAERQQAEEVHKRLTMVGGVGKVKCEWYAGPLDVSVLGAPKTELEVESLYGDSDLDMDDDVKMDDVLVKEEDLDVAAEDDWGLIS